MNPVLFFYYHYLGHPEAKSDQIPWRDHWMQAVYYLPERIEVHEGEQHSLIASHDEYSLWFRLNNDHHHSSSRYSIIYLFIGLYTSIYLIFLSSS